MSNSPNRSAKSRHRKREQRKRRRGRHQRQPPRKSPPRFIASEVAEALARDTECSEREGNELFLVALDIGQHLADCEHPGRWDLFEAETFFPKLRFLGQPMIERLGQRAIAMFEYLADVRALPRARVIRICTDIKDACEAGPCPALPSFPAT